MLSYHHLSLSERKKLRIYWKETKSIREVARRLGRSPSTISRELKRNITRDKRFCAIYRPVNAQKKYMARIHKPKGGKYDNEKLTSYVQCKLLLTWSPEQVAGRIALDYQDDASMRVSHTTIYRWLHKGQVSQAAQIRLRHAGHRHGEHRGKYLGIRTLKQRGREIQRRSRIGDWELDTIVSSARESRAGILSMVDRKSRFCVLTLLERCHSNKHVFRALASIVQQYPCKSFTADQGSEFGCYRRVEEELQIPMYFCRPSSPWQKGSVENLNGLIREMFPKGTNFVDVTPEEVSHAMSLLNNRPRKCLSWHTPAEVFFAL